MIRVVLDYQGIKKYEASHQAQSEVKKIADHLAERAKQILLRQVKHTDPVTPPPAVDSFYVEQTKDGYRMGNDDPAIIFIEYGSHPGGGHTEVMRYAPIRKALDELQGGAQ